MYLSKLAARKAYLLMVLSLAHVGSKCAEASALRGAADKTGGGRGGPKMVTLLLLLLRT